MNLQRIAVACAAECERQQVGLDRLALLLTAYDVAVRHAESGEIGLGIVLHLAGVAEPVSRGTFRTTPVTFRIGGSAADAGSVPAAMVRLFDNLDDGIDPAEFCRAFLSIHPFVDGNGRVAFLVYNWLAGTLGEPNALPDLFRDGAS